MEELLEEEVGIEEEEEKGDDGDDEVMSEVHIGCPPNFPGPFISRFTFPFPISTAGRYKDQLQSEGSPTLMLSLDDDGDLALPRRKSNSERYPIYTLTIQHSITSSIPSVGLQVWKAALVLIDFILHKITTSSEFDGITAVEFGAGTGLVGIVLALAARTVFVTDRGSDVLNNCAINARLNSSLLQDLDTRIRVRELDWNEQWTSCVQPDDSQSQRLRYSWTLSEIEEAERASVLLAADVIYSDELTDAFFGTVKRLMSRGSVKVLYLALEKRYNFSMDDLDVVANGYAHFQSYLDNEKECRKFDDRLLPCFKGEQLELAEIPQYIREYERGNDVELWKITYSLEKAAYSRDQTS